MINAVDISNGKVSIMDNVTLTNDKPKTSVFLYEVMDRLDANLERLEYVIKTLQEKVTPVAIYRDTPKSVDSETVPEVSQLASRLYSMEGALNRRISDLNYIIDSIEL